MLKKIFSFFLPWSLRRPYLNYFFGYDISPKAKIGLAWVFPKKLVMKPYSKISHFTVAIHLDYIELSEFVSIGRSNWITGFASGTNSKHFKHQPKRSSQLLVGAHSAITKNHHLDCTNTLSIGSFVTIAGYQSQFLTHSIDVMHNRQDSKPIHIGDYCFISTNVVVLGGSVLPSHSLLAAKALLNKAYDASWTLYGGVPAKAIKEISKDASYFTRKDGFVY